MKCSINTELARKDLEKLTLGLPVSHVDQFCSTHIEIKRSCCAIISDSEPCSAKRAEPRDCLYFQVLRSGDACLKALYAKAARLCRCSSGRFTALDFSVVSPWGSSKHPWYLELELTILGCGESLEACVASITAPEQISDPYL